ncbi:cyclohexadienyl dehydratase [Allostella vacuolata]|nr:cyclohexadienyl dehydratase [Stella vacuolata]
MGLLPALLALAPVLARGEEARSGLAAVQAAGVVRVCIWPDYYAITFRNARNGQLQGIDIDLSRELAADLGVGLVHVETTFGTLIEDLEDGRCDVAMFGVGVTDRRRERLDFTRPYLASGIYAVTARSGRRIRQWQDIDQPGVVVAVQRGTFHEPFMHTYLKHARLMVVQPPQTREVEVQSGRADVFMTDYPYSRRMLFQHDWAQVIVPPEPTGVTPYAYAVRKGQPEWLSRLDAFVAAIRQDGRLEAAARRHELLPIMVR